MRIALVCFWLAVCAWAQPKRIVSTFPSATETLFALGAGDRVVGVSDYCRYPEAARALPKIGSYSKPDAEKIALLRPDLVVIPAEQTRLAERLGAVGIRSVRVRMRTLAEVFSTIREIGAAVGAEDRAEKLNREIHAKLDTIRAESAGRSKPAVLMIVGRTPGLLTNLIAVGPPAYLSELLEIAGGRNALSDTTVGYPHISLETAVRLDPDVILDMSMMGDQAEESRLREPWLARHELKAVKNGKVFGLADETPVTPGPRVVDAVEEIRKRIR